MIDIKQNLCIAAIIMCLTLVGCSSFAADDTTLTSDMTSSAKGTSIFENIAYSISENSSFTITDEMKLRLNEGTVNMEPDALPPPPDEIVVNLSSIGDIMAHEGTYASAKRGNSYDFTNMFSEIAPYLQDADFVFGNLETTFSGSKRGYSGYPCFNTPEQMGSAMKSVLGIDLVSHANNHTLDCGISGVESTIEYLDDYGIAHTGSYKSEPKSYYMADINGAKIAFLGYTYGTNNPVKKSYSINIISKAQIKEDAARARADGAQYIIAMLHWGVEYKRFASEEQKTLAKWIFNNSEVDLIMGNHAHVTEPIEEISYKRNGIDKKGIVFYALGNFTGAQRWEYTDTGIIANIKLIINPSDISKNHVEEITYTPTFIDPNNLSTGKRYRVVSLNKAIADYQNGSDPLISTDEYNRIKGYKSAYKKMLETLPYVKEFDKIL